MLMDASKETGAEGTSIPRTRPVLFSACVCICAKDRSAAGPNQVTIKGRGRGFHEEEPAPSETPNSSRRDALTIYRSTHYNVKISTSLKSAQTTGAQCGVRTHSPEIKSYNQVRCSTD